LKCQEEKELLAYLNSQSSNLYTKIVNQNIDAMEEMLGLLDHVVNHCFIPDVAGNPGDGSQRLQFITCILNFPLFQPADEHAGAVH
jgi:hypothetical protein